jgi:hypothetical protein
MNTQTRALLLGLSVVACVAACGEAIEAPLPSADLPAGLVPDGGTARPTVPGVLFPSTVTVDTPEALVEALGLVLCKLQFACCGLSLANRADVAHCAAGVSEVREFFADEIAAVEAGRRTFDAPLAKSCATALLGFVNLAVTNGACERSLDEVMSTPLALLGPRLGTFASSGVSVTGVFYSGLQCIAGVFAPTVGVGGACAGTDEEGTPVEDYGACRDGLYCRDRSMDGDGGTGYVCVAQAGIGGACDWYEGCIEGAWCRRVGSLDSGTCMALVPDGGPCESDEACENYGACIDRRCVVAASGNAVGEPCLGPEDCASGQCDARLGVCMPSAYLGAGAPCGDIPPDTACALGLRCDFDADVPTCIAPTRSAGEACTRGLDCLSGVCLDAGRCARTLTEASCEHFGEVPVGVPAGEEDAL